MRIKIAALPLPQALCAGEARADWTTLESTDGAFPESSVTYYLEAVVAAAAGGST